MSQPKLANYNVKCLNIRSYIHVLHYKIMKKYFNKNIVYLCPQQLSIIWRLNHQNNNVL